jgi:hypothetical protein
MADLDGGRLQGRGILIPAGAENGSGAAASRTAEAVA